MAFLAVNKDGTEIISRIKPYRDLQYGFFECIENIGVGSHCSCSDASVTLPKGSILKLIGRELTWNDEPVELK